MFRIGWTSSRPGVIITNDGLTVNLYETCPRSVEILAQEAVEDFLLKRTVANDDRLRIWGPGSRPWLEPLKHLVNGKQTANWINAHQSPVRTNAAGTLWTPDVLFEKRGVGDGSC